MFDPYKSFKKNFKSIESILLGWYHRENGPNWYHSLPKIDEKKKQILNNLVKWINNYTWVEQHYIMNVFKWVTSLS